MDLSSLKDMDVKDLLSKLKGGQAIFSDKKMLIKFGIIFGAIVIFLIIYYLYINPTFQDQKAQIKDMNYNETETNRMIEQEVDLEAKIKSVESLLNVIAAGVAKTNGSLERIEKDLEGLFRGSCSNPLLCKRKK